MARDGVRTYGEIQNEALGDNAVLNNLALVKRIALHLKARVPDIIELDDMIQVGTIGLMEAVKSFRPDEGVEFDFFAKTRIKGSILDEVRRLSSLPRSAISNIKSHNEAIKTLNNKLGREPRNSEVADHLGISLDQFEHEREHANRFQTIPEESSSALSERVDTRAHSINPQDSVQDNEVRSMLADEIKNLPERDQLVLSLYYEKELHLKEIGAIIGVNESRVSQILSATAKKLRATINKKVS